MELSKENCSALQNLVNQISENFEFQGNNETRFDYSGRCMGRDRCFGVVTPDMGLFLLALGSVIDELGDDDDIKYYMFKDVHWDNMGRESIVYFPRLTVSQEVLEQFEDEVLEEFDEDLCSRCKDGLLCSKKCGNNGQ